MLQFSFDRHITTTGMLWTLRIGLVKPLAAGLLSCITHTRPHGSCLGNIYSYQTTILLFETKAFRCTDWHPFLHKFWYFFLICRSVYCACKKSVSCYFKVLSFVYKRRMKITIFSFFVSLFKRCRPFRGWARKFLFLCLSYCFLKMFCSKGNDEIEDMNCTLTCRNH